MIKKEFLIKNLHCANCATKIENNIKKMNIIEEINLDVYTSKLFLTLKSEMEEDVLIKKLNFICDKIEPGTFVASISQEKTIHEHQESLDNQDNYIDELEHSHSHNDADENKILFWGLSEKNLNNFLLAFGSFLFFYSFFVKSLPILYFITLLIAYLLVSYDVLLTSFKNIKRGNFLDENFLMTIATFGAFAIKEYSEAVAVMIFYKIGEYYQEKAISSSKKSIEKLLSLKSVFANIKGQNGEITKVSPEKVAVGDIIISKPGEKIPLDGHIIKGNSSLDLAALTGESVPIDVTETSNVLSGSINLSGVLEIKVDKTYKESTINKIIEMVQNAHNKKPAAVKFITKFASYYTPIVVSLAFLIATVPPFFTDIPASVWFYRALIFLVISCPCALVLSIPLTFFSSIGFASKHGLLIKGGNYLERLFKIDSVVFDKTGTLTEGKFKVDEIILNNTDLSTLMEIAKAGEFFSNHPIGKAILNYGTITINSENIKDYKEIPGMGVSAIYKNEPILIGNLALMKNNNIKTTEINSYKTIVYISKNDIFLGAILISDIIKHDSKEAVESIKSLGVNVYMLTGDNTNIALDIGKEIGIDHDKIRSQLLPQDKVTHLEKIKQLSSKGTIFIGDGINDAPVLAMSDVGIAMGGIGSDIAIEAADIVIMTDEPKKVFELLKLAKTTRKILIENIILALGTKAIVMILGVLGYANLWLAIFADVGVSFLSVLNASKILKSSSIKK